MRKKLSTSFLTWLCVIAGVLLPLSILFFDSPERDECYQALCVLNYDRSPLAPLTFFNGYLWLSVFGDTLLNLRILNLLCHLVSISLGCWIFVRRTGDRLWAAVMFMTLGTASQVWAMHIYNWDTGCYPFAMLCLVASLAFWRTPSWWRMGLLAVTAALFGLSRLPCIAVLPALAVVVALRYRGNTGRMCVRTLAFTALSAGVAALVLLLMYGGPDGVVRAFSPENIITGHGVADIQRYIDRIKTITPQLAVESMLPLMCMVASFVMANLRRNRVAVALVMMGCIEAILFFLLVIIPVRTYFCLLWFPCVFLWFYPVMRTLPGEGRFSSPGYAGWLTMLFICLPIIGSDGFQERFMVLPALPVLAALCYPYLKRYIRYFTLFSMLAASSMAFVKEAYYISKGMECVGDAVPRFGGIIFDSNNALAVREQARICDSFCRQGKRLVIIGDNRYQGAFSLGLEMVADLHIFHFGNFESDRSMYESRFPEIDALMVFYPVYYSHDAISYEVDQEGNDNLEKLIQQSGFEKVDTVYPNFVMYVRP